MPPVPASRLDVEAAGPGGLSLVDGLVQLSFTVQGILGRVAATYDLSIVQTRLLGILRDRQLGMLELARVMNLEKSSVTGLIDRAERRGLVARTANPDDGRSVKVTLTPRGYGLAQAFASEVGGEVEVLAAGLSAADRRHLASLAERVVSTVTPGPDGGR